MWKEFLRTSLHDPVIWFAFLAAIVLVFGLRAQVRRRRLIEKFAMARGYTFQRVLESRAFRFSDTDFFRRLDRATNAVSGNLDDAQFTLFDHEAHRGKYSSFTQTIVAFTIAPSAAFRPTMLGSYGFQIEKTASHIFLWKEKWRVPVDGLDPFLHSALNVFQQAIR
jgi:hypothetical protein